MDPTIHLAAHSLPTHAMHETIRILAEERVSARCHHSMQFTGAKPLSNPLNHPQSTHLRWAIHRRQARDHPAPQGEAV